MFVTPVPARTDAPAGTTPAAPGRPAAGISLRTISRLGAGLAAGGFVWALGSFFNDMTKISGGWYAHSTLAFQAGLLMLLTVQTRTRATGTGKVARGFMILEHVLVLGAIVSTLNDAFLPGLHGSVIWHVFDAFWPLSMLGMLGIGIRIAIAGRWRGVARFWPLIAESWAIVVIPAVGVSAGFGGLVSGLHLLVGYTTLGLILALKPHLVQPRD